MTDALKSKMDMILEYLPPRGQEELEQFLDFLADKYHGDQEQKILALGGVWKNTPLEVSDEEIRELRSDISKQLIKKIDNGLSS